MKPVLLFAALRQRFEWLSASDVVPAGAEEYPLLVVNAPLLPTCKQRATMTPQVEAVYSKLGDDNRFVATLGETAGTRGVFNAASDEDIFGAVDDASGRLAAVGCLVSAEVRGEHEVLHRVRLHKVANGRCRVTLLKDPPEDTPWFDRRPKPYETRIFDLLGEIYDLQKTLDEDVCFKKDAIAALGARAGNGVGSLWHLANACWTSYCKAQTTMVARRFYDDVQQRVVAYLEKRDTVVLTEDDVYYGRRPRRRCRSKLKLAELPRSLRVQVASIKGRIAYEIQPNVDQHRMAQLLLQAPSHRARCDTFATLLRTEKKRLQAKIALHNLLHGASEETFLTTEFV